MLFHEAYPATYRLRIDRSLERELGLLADERKDRARRFGIEAGLVSPETGK